MASVSPSRSAAVARHELRLIRRDPVYLLTFIFMPLIVMAFIKPVFRYMVAPNISGVNGSEQAVPGVTVMFSMFLVGSVGFGFFREYGWGTWERVRASWASPAEIMVGKTLVPMLQSALQLGVLFGVGGVLLGLHVRGSLIALVLVAAAFCISFFWPRGANKRPELRSLCTLKITGRCDITRRGAHLTRSRSAEASIAARRCSRSVEASAFTSRIASASASSPWA